ncbi:hypothetical protein CSC82_03785 [Rhodobacteraceae bacterium 4F10]|nr:hypothetical protein CSC82_03785 [Rhodobacteraceae bacterium 4F10]
MASELEKDPDVLLPLADTSLSFVASSTGLVQIKIVGDLGRKMFDFCLNELLEKRGVELGSTRLVRHDTRALIAWRQGVRPFDHFVSFQRNDNKSPYNQAKIAVQFVPSGSTQAVFVGAHEILDFWAANENPDRLPILYDSKSGYDASENHRRYDLNRIPVLEDLVGRVTIDWGSSTRSWSQWAARHNKPIVELRAHAQNDPFPGFGAFASTVNDILTMPVEWQNALASVGGVYLLVCPSTGEQYVGSAYGEEGFLGRWSNYAFNGHGGNKLLIGREKTNFAVSILEVSSPDMSSSEIISRESAWKTKLGTRAHGLNAN